MSDPAPFLASASLPAPPAADPVSRRLPAALIMAAGRGNRLLPHTRHCPKCLLEVGGTPLLIHQIRALRAAGVATIQIVTGHGRELLHAACATLAADGLSFANNDHYATTSSLYSLGCVTHEPGDAGVLILNSDVLFHPTMLRRLLDDPREQVLLADFTSSLGEEEMKICVDTDHRLTAISKTLDPLLAQAENVGVLKVGREAARRMIEMARRPGDFKQVSWIPDSIHLLRHDFDFYVLSTGGLPWIEIDYPHDLERARKVVWPALAGVLA